MPPKGPTKTRPRRLRSDAKPLVERTSGRIYTNEEYQGQQAEREATISRQVTRGQRKSRLAESEAEKERRARVAARTPPPAPAGRRSASTGGRRQPSPAKRSRGRSKSSTFKVPHIRGNPQRILLAELVGASFVVTAGRLGNGEAPELMDYVPVWLVFLLLSLATHFGPKTGRLAVAFGGLLTLAIVLRDVAPFTRTLVVAANPSGAALPSDFPKGSTGRGGGRKKG